MLDVADLRATLVRLKLTGELNRNNPEAIRQVIREILKGNQYWAMGAAGIDTRRLTYESIAHILVRNLGLTMTRFESSEPPYIDPDHTTSRLITAIHRLEDVASVHGKIMFATAHPGSLLTFYQTLATYVAGAGAQLIGLTVPVPAPEKRWLDDAGGVIVLSDEGNLMHTHAPQSLPALIAKTKPDMIMADHAFAVAAINADIPTAAIFDVDDVVIPILASDDPDRFVAVPMNDNQTNSRTVQAAVALIETINHASSLRNPPLARPASRA
jgi:hypothetical protein